MLERSLRFANSDVQSCLHKASEFWKKEFTPFGTSQKLWRTMNNSHVRLTWWLECHTGIERAEALFYIAEKSDEPKASAYMALAVAAADEIEDEGERDRMLSTILAAQLKGNHFGGAWSTMPKIQTERYYSRSIRHFAVTAARSGHVEMAEWWVGKLSRCYPLEKKIANSEIEIARTYERETPLDLDLRLRR